MGLPKEAGSGTRRRPPRPRGGWAKRLAAALTLLVTVDVGVLVGLASAGRQPGELAETVSLIVAFTIFFIVGVVIVLKHARHPVGWLLVATGAYPMTQAALNELGMSMIETPQGEALVLVANLVFSWPVLLGTLVVFVPLLFPTGRLPSPRWRWLAWLAGSAMVTMYVGGIVQRDVCVLFGAAEQQCLRRLDNPVGLEWVPNIEESTAGSVLFGVLAVCMVATAASLIVRYRRSSGVERAQLRLFAFASGLFIGQTLLVGVVLESMLGLGPQIEELMPDGVDLFGLFLAPVPISVGVAITRYRLYDMDRLISRTVTYGLVTAVLVAAYAGTVFVLRTLVPAQSDLAVVVSTLGVAALFNPVRRRVQAAVDHRFNRRRYDAERIIDAFGSRLRSAFEVDDLRNDLLEVVGSAMQPASASVWFKGTPAEPVRR